MAVFKFSALNDGQSLVFNPTVDVLDFDQTTVAAADLRVTQVGSNIRIDVVSGTQTGKDVTLQNVSPLQLATTNVTFADGSKLLFGDNSTAQNDNLANSLTGTAGRDLLQGFGGADTLNGGAGNDTYIVGTGDVLSDTGGVDTVVSDISWTLADGFENLTLTGAGNISATGNNAANLLVGNSGDNFFNPRGGDDTIQAGAGNDLIRLGGGGVPTYGTKVIDGGAGFDTLDFGGFAKSAIVVDLAAGTLKGGGDAGQGSATLISIETVVGDAFDDRISGSGSTESLAGGGGNDTLDGRGGADTLTGGAGADTFAFSTVPFANDTDRVADFVSATDKLSFDNSVFNALGAPGNFAAGDARFASGAGLTSGQDASDRLIYNTTTGQLFFDADGNGAGASVRVATLQGAPALAATDIVVTGQSGSAIQGTEGNDTLTGTAGNDTIDGLGGNDLISGLAAADSLIGGAGNDSLDGGAGNDTLSGGLGADTFAFSAAPNGNTNADLVTDFVSGTDKLSLDNNAFTTMGPAGDFDAAHFRAGPGFTSGGSESDRLVYNTTTGELFYTPRGDLGGTLLVAKLQGAPALAASDIVIAGRGPIEGTPGNDSLTGTTADDSILGLGGNDTLDGVGGDDTLRGGDGDDTLIDHVNGGPDIPGQLLDGGLGNDTYDLLAHPFDGRPPAIIVDAGGVDTVLSNHGFVLPDGIENLTLFEGLRGTGNAQNNLIITRGSEFGLHQVDAREGNDTIISGSDRDEMTGGLGNDTFAFRLVPHPIDATGVRVQSDEVEDFASGADRLQFDNTAFTQLGALGNFTSGDARFVSGGGLTSGQDSSDRLVYDSTNGDLYYDADGNGAGASVLVAHLTGAPALAAADITVVGNAGAPGSNVQGTAGNDSLTGTEGNDSISGLAGNDTINALGGDDTLDGGAGVDNLNGGLGNDTYIVTVGDVLSDTGGIDTVMTDTGGWTLADGFENLTLVGTGNVAGTGNNAANVLIGNSGNNFFNPRGGDDTIQTGAGNDEVRLGGGGVPSYGTKVIDGGAGFDTLDFGGFAKSAIVVDLAAGTLKGGGDAGQGSATLISFETVVGDGFNDRISGSAVAESLDGGAGNDTLDGSGGADTLTGGLGTDTFAFSTTPGGANVDRVADFVSATDKLSFDNAAFTALGGLGNFAAGDARFGAGAGFTSGQDASDRLIYNTTTGQLFYDADGNGAGASLLVATLQGAPALVASDIVVTGQPGSATIQGTEGNDTLTGTPGNDTIDGRGGNDLISGLDGADSLIGGAGNDTLDGGAGADTMDGGLGDDTFVTTSRFAHGIADQLADAGGTDTLIVDGDGNEVFLPDGFENVTYRGAGAASFGDSELFGNAADNVIRNESDGSGFFMNGGAGNDTLIGSEHQDWFLVSAGNDVADGGADLDRIALGSAGVVDFRAGTATTASGSMTFSNVEGAQGGAGADRLVANDSGNSLSGGGGNDTILGGAGNDTLSDDFEPRSDSPTMPIGDDSISGGAGDDLIVVSRGNDTVQGDAGNDVIVINIFDVFNGSDTDSIDGGDGIDTLKVIGASATVDLAAGTFTDVNNASNHATFTSIENVTLDSAGPSLVSGTSGGNQLAGAFGDDTLNGRAGNDTLTGDRGDFAGPHAVGADHFVFDQTPGAANADVVTDFQSASDTLDLDASVMAQLGGSGRFGAGDGRFFAAAGATGGHDADDRVVYDTSTGNLYYDADGSGAGSGQLIATLQGASALTATDILVVGGAPAPGVHVVGTEGNDTLFGTNGSDTIDGLGGDDVLDGGAGIDVLHGGAGNDRLKDRDDSNLAAPDTLDGGLGDDIYDFLASPLRPHSTVIVDAGGIDTVWSNHDFVLPSGIENLTLFEGQVGTGNELGNMMVSNGNVGRYFMDGAGGNDTLAGAPDSFNNLTGGAGNDVFAFARPSNPTQGAFDTLSDFTSGADRLQFDNTGFTQIGAAGNFAPGDARFATTHGLHEGQDATDRLIYDIDSFNLYYDPDGNGSTQATLVAHLDGPRVLAATDIVVVGAGAPGGFVINGTAGNDSINGTEGNDSISGLAGNDTINALGGDDTLDGGAGIDNLNGGLGNDTYIVTVGDVLSDTGGIDTVITDVSGWTLADGFENLTLSGTANTAGTGNNAANVLTGNSGNNFFNPRGGDDTILAGAGNDLIRLGGGGVPSYGNKVIDGGDGFDTLDFGGFAKSAISVDLGAGTLGGGGEAGQGTARLAGIEAVIGEGFNDALTGSAGADSLNGGAGNDFLSGGAGNDTLESGVGQDSLNGGAGQDSFVFRQAPLTSGGVDFLTDFTSGSDKLLFDNAAFTALGADGAFTVNDARFVTGTAARDASDRLIYDSTTGVLLYDPDGTGSMSAGQVATLVGHPALAATDISVI